VLLLLQPEKSVYRLLYRGPIGVAGVNVQQFLDLTALPEYIRRLPTFKDDFRVFVRQLDLGVSSVEDTVEFFPPVGIPVESMVITVTAANVNNLVNIEVWFLHSILR
jgi:hypothetical protein